MKNREPKTSRPIETEPGARVPFFAKNLDPQALRSIRGGDDPFALMATEMAAKQAGG